MKRKHAIVLAIMAVVIAGAYFGVTAIKSFIESTESNQKKLADLIISDVDVSKTADGTYTGSYAVFPVSAEVKVAVKDHKIAGIELVKHRHGRGAAAEVIPDRVVEAQTLRVDIVSGATSSSKVILKAIENALNSAR